MGTAEAAALPLLYINTTTLLPSSTRITVAHHFVPTQIFLDNYCQSRNHVRRKDQGPYCKATKALLTELGANYYTIELDQVDDGSAIQAALKEINGQTSVPNIYIKQKHIGGNSDLQAIKGNLKGLLTDAGAL